MDTSGELVEDRFSRQLAIRLAIGAAILALLPFLFANFIAKPAGSTYVGMQTAIDDNMVYASWMHQAAEGKFLFENRFAVEDQPGLTFNLWFLVLGWISKVLGTPWTLALSRAGFAALAIWLLYQLVRRVTPDAYLQKLATATGAIGGGIGFIAWQITGIDFNGEHFLKGLLGGHLPTDVWQTEGFFFPSLLVNGLFMVSLCLILFIFQCVLDARVSKKPVIPGALAFLVLMNIHSYDVLLVLFVLVGFLASLAFSKQVEKAWIGRVVCMGLGAIPAALWFVYVLKNDPVFQSRAATETFAADGRAMLFGYLPLIALGIYGFLIASKEQRGKAGFGLLALILLALFVLSGQAGYMVGLPVWILLFALSVGAAALIGGETIGLKLCTAWASVGLIAPYFPTLFQRKLAMGLSVPWGILAGLGLGVLFLQRERGVRNLVAAFGLLLLAGSSVQWFTRELTFAKGEYGSTLRHPIYLSPEVTKILAEIERIPGRKVVLAFPGAMGYLPDLNPYAAGLAGATTYAGHWSETPGYSTGKPSKVSEATGFFLGQMTDEERRAFIADKKIDLVIAPMPEAYPELARQGNPLADVRGLGDVLAGGSQFVLVKVR